MIFLILLLLAAPAHAQWTASAVDVGRVRFQLRHMSNAGLHMPNYGENWLMAGWRFGDD